MTMLHKLFAPVALLCGLLFGAGCDRHAHEAPRANGGQTAAQSCADHYFEGREPQINHRTVMRAIESYFLTKD